MRIKTLLLCSALAVACGCSGGADNDQDVVIEAVSPARGPLGGGNEVTITGRGFISGNATPNHVLIGGVMSPNVHVIDNATIVAIAPPGIEPSTVDVTLYNSKGFETVEASYEYNPRPTITEITPNTTDRLGGEVLTIRGSGFADREPGQNRILLGDTEITDVTVESDTSLTFMAPRGEPFSLSDVTIENANGAAMLSQGLEFTATGLVTIQRFGDPEILLHFVDIETAEVTPIRKADPSTTNNYTALSKDANGTLYAMSTDGRLVEVDMRGNETEIVNFGERIPGMAFMGSTLMGNAKFRGVVSLDIETGEMTDIGPLTGFPGGLGMAFDPSGTLFSVHDDAVRIIDPGDGSVVQEIGQIIGFGRVGGLAFHNGELFGAMPQFGLIARIDLKTAQITPVATLNGADALESLP